MNNLNSNDLSATVQSEAEYDVHVQQTQAPTSESCEEQGEVPSKPQGEVRVGRSSALAKMSIKALMAEVEAEMQDEPLPSVEEVLAESRKPIDFPDEFLEYERELMLREERRQENILRRQEELAGIEPYRCRASDDIPEPRPVISQYDMTICSRGNISAIVGDAKSKKTFLCTAIVGAMLNPTEDIRPFGIRHSRQRVLWIDTEQSAEHIQRVLYRLNVLSRRDKRSENELVYTLALRELDPLQRKLVAEKAIELFLPQLVVIDGVSDLMYNTNAADESETLVSRLLTLSKQYDCHIMVVLHTNPNSDKARGHIGSTLLRKSEAVFFVRRVGDVSIVEPQFCRNPEFESFAFHIIEAENSLLMNYPSAEGLGIPEQCAIPREGNTQEDDCVRILRDHLNGVAERKQLCSKLESVLGITNTNARVKVSRAVSRGYIVCDNDSIVSLP